MFLAWIVFSFINYNFVFNIEKLVFLIFCLKMFNLEEKVCENKNCYVEIIYKRLCLIFYNNLW